MSVGDDVMISVDPHKASNTLAVMDPVTKAVIARQRFVNSAGGYRRLREFAGGWADRRWAVEGCHGAGRGLAQRLVGDVELVLDVPAKLAARVRVYSQGHGRKTDLLTELSDRVFRWLRAVSGVGWLGSVLVINDGDVPRELSALVVPLRGSLEATGDLFEPYRLVDGDGVAVGPVGGVLRGVGGVRAAGDDAAFVWDGSAALVPVLVGGRGGLGSGDPGRGA